MVLGILWRRNSARKEKRLQKENSRSTPLPTLTDGQFSTAEENSERRGKGRKNERPLHLPRYTGREGPESLVQGEVGGRIEEGPEDGQAPTVREKQSQEVLKGLSEVQTLSQGLIEDPEDFWFDVHWTETSSDKAKAGQIAGCWWETDDC